MCASENINCETIIPTIIAPLRPIYLYVKIIGNTIPMNLNNSSPTSCIIVDRIVIIGVPAYALCDCEGIPNTFAIKVAIPITRKTLIKPMIIIFISFFSGFLKISDKLPSKEYHTAINGIKHDNIAFKSTMSPNSMKGMQNVKQNPRNNTINFEELSLGFQL